MNDKSKNDESLAKADSLTDVDQVEALTSQEKQAKEAQNASSNPANVTQKEVGGPKGLEPTRYGDWESKGRCYDF